MVRWFPSSVLTSSTCASFLHTARPCSIGYFLARLIFSLSLITFLPSPHFQKSCLCLLSPLTFFCKFKYAAAAAKSLQSCPTLCNPIDGSPLGYPVPGILQARTLEWVAISFSNAWKWKVKVKLLTSWWAHFMSLPGFSVRGIFQARVLEWGANAFSVFKHSWFIMLC